MNNKEELQEQEKAFDKLFSENPDVEIDKNKTLKNDLWIFLWQKIKILIESRCLNSKGITMDDDVNSAILEFFKYCKFKPEEKVPFCKYAITCIIKNIIKEKIKNEEKSETEKEFKIPAITYNEENEEIDLIEEYPDKSPNSDVSEVISANDYVNIKFIEFLSAVGNFVKEQNRDGKKKKNQAVLYPMFMTEFVAFAYMSVDLDLTSSHQLLLEATNCDYWNYFIDEPLDDAVRNLGVNVSKAIRGYVSDKDGIKIIIDVDKLMKNSCLEAKIPIAFLGIHTEMGINGKINDSLISDNRKGFDKIKATLNR